MLQRLGSETAAVPLGWRGAPAADNPEFYEPILDRLRDDVGDFAISHDDFQGTVSDALTALTESSTDAEIEKAVSAARNLVAQTSFDFAKLMLRSSRYVSDLAGSFTEEGDTMDNSDLGTWLSRLEDIKKTYDTRVDGQGVEAPQLDCLYRQLRGFPLEKIHRCDGWYGSAIMALNGPLMALSNDVDATDTEMVSSSGSDLANKEDRGRLSAPSSDAAETRRTVTTLASARDLAMNMNRLSMSISNCALWVIKAVLEHDGGVAVSVNGSTTAITGLRGAVPHAIWQAGANLELVSNRLAQLTPVCEPSIGAAESVEGAWKTKVEAIMDAFDNASASLTAQHIDCVSQCMPLVSRAEIVTALTKTDDFGFKDESNPVKVAAAMCLLGVATSFACEWNAKTAAYRATSSARPNW